ncbi:MAG: SIS domain-containing protein [Candidatus Levybacteria bacterium]|nr:SIS domain-containing protein [Candidatus Levybacteria bacterium]
MKNLNDLEVIKKIDPQNTLGSTNQLIMQCQSAWKEVNEILMPQDFSSVSNIVFCGMGASIYGALVFKSLLGSNTKFPIEIISDYHLPAYVNENSLVVLTSYSGTTEEVISCAVDALQKKSKMLILTKGGPLGDIAKKNNIPSYIFDGKLNIANIPRLGNGYTILGLLGLLRKSNLININEKEIIDAFLYVKNKEENIKEKAMSDAKIYIGKIPIIFGAEHLSGNAQIMRNQFNETSKTFSSYYLVPDLNHHLMEGLQFPQPSILQFILLNSNQYTEKIKLRMNLTIDVVKNNNQLITEFKLDGKTIYDDFIETMIYGSYLTLYLGLIYDQNPSVNPWVDYFKEKLK